MSFFLLIQYVFIFFVNLRPNKSLPNSRTIKLIGVKIMKKTIAITIGAIIFPKSSPNLIQIEFNGDNNLEFISPKIKKMIEIISK